MNPSFLLATALLALPAAAQHAPHGHAPAESPKPVMEAAPSAPPAWAEATVRRIDAPNGRITLRHGRIENLDMPPMSMVFRIDAARLDSLKPGDTVRFQAERRDGAYWVTAIERKP